MPIFIKIFFESIVLSIKELISNPLRTMLSLLGVSIGIFCVIAVLSVVDSFKAGLEESFEEIGEDVLHVDRNTWDFQTAVDNWWKYMKRPQPSYKDYQALKKKVKSADAVTIRAFVDGQKMQFRSSTVENAVLVGTDYDFARIFDVEIGFGRYFTPQEMAIGNNNVVLGYVLAETLFPNVAYGVGKTIKVNGRTVKVIGIAEKEGESILGDGFDEVVISPYQWFRNYYNVKSRSMNHIISVRAKDDISLDRLREEMRGVLRGVHHLKPKQEDDFEINHMSLLSGMIDKVFFIATFAGSIIGLLAMVVGAIGIANIMFVSVKERTRQIGIKKSLGAKRRYILLEFLVESILLTLLGGLIGFLLVMLMTFTMNQFIDSFEVFVGTKNLIVGTLICVVIGVVAGIIPAISAALMDPVKAIRT